MRRRRPGHGHHLRAPLLTSGEPYARVDLVRWTGPVDPDHPDANLHADVAAYAQADPLRTLGNLAAEVGLPPGAVVHYVLARYAAGGSDGLLELGPAAVGELADVAERAEAAGTDEARLAAYHELRQRLAWLRVPLDDPSRDGGGEAKR